MENLFIEIIIKSHQQRKLIAVYTNKDNLDTFSVGYIDFQVEEGILLQAIDPNGFEDGLIFINIGDIYLIETDSKYLRNLEILKSETLHFANSNSFAFDRNKDESLIFDFLNQCLTRKLLVTIKLFFGKGVTGFITNIDEEAFCLNAVNEDGEGDGDVYIKIEDVERVYLDGLEQKRINVLLAKNK